MTSSIQPVSSKTETKVPLNLELKEPHGSLVLRVIDLYKRDHYYKLDKMQPTLVAAIVHIDPIIIEQAIKIYETAKDKRTGKTPHPNYFVGIAKRMHEESIRADEEKKTQREKPGFRFACLSPGYIRASLPDSTARRLGLPIRPYSRI